MGEPKSQPLAAPTVVRMDYKKGAACCDVYIGRRVQSDYWNLDATIWGNPYRLPKNPTYGERRGCIEQFRKHLLASPHLMVRLPDLAGKRLGCWCKPDACHGDVLVDCFVRLRDGMENVGLCMKDGLSVWQVCEDAKKCGLDVFTYLADLHSLRTGAWPCSSSPPCPINVD